ncbi:amidohydrolase [Muriicola sp. Z0-33]|uniref:amidohydrolase n=1 Tax=Muriicola sp. Z0-33 TaxID=2816957 RepID=UPI0022378936|nr:amidohydrolase [Muriicola sp. Z0-33]MCW5518038.1 amidohydrolase [Muriicola sp. Z0-33]
MRKLIICISLVFFACEMTKDEVDLIVLNANVYTVDGDFSKADAFAVKGGKFIAVGNATAIREQYTSNQIVDAEGKTIIPGIIDAHCHFNGLGLNQTVVDLVGTTSYEEVLERVLQFHEENPSEFILGRGWDQNDWEVKEFPTKIELDTLFPEIPVALRRVDGHALLVNQKALDLAGIDWRTQVTGGEIVRKRGIITGVLVDSPMQFVTEIIPPPDRAAQIRALKAAEQICFDNGLTTVNDAGLDRSTIELIDSLQNVGELSIRVYAMVSNSPENLDYYLDKGIIKTDKLHVRSVKVYGDGALGSRGAALKAPYSDLPGHYGAMVTPVSDIEALAERIAASEYQMNTHAIGDSANVVVLRAYQKALEGKPDRRWKVEHAQVISEIDFNFFSENIIPSIQPTHATSDMYWADERLGAERVKGAYAFKKLLEASGKVALGTDFPVEQVSPFLTFYAAVARKDIEGYPEGGFQMQDALSREETLKGMTIWAAYSNFEENEKGSIEVGKLADFTILSDDIMVVPEEEIPNIEAEHVYIDGRIAE